MDYQKAIEALRLEGLVEITGKPRRVAEFFDGIDVAISAMHELQLYKDGKLCLIPESVYSKQCTELDAYKQLGTLEEVYGIFGYIEYECRECGNTVNYMDEYCKYCGKKQDWEVLEL